MPSHPVIDIAKIIVQIEGSKINTNKITTIKLGIEATISRIRCITLSTLPPKNPEMAPYTTPMKISKIAATIPINKEIWAPFHVRVHKSRPS